MRRTMSTVHKKSDAYRCKPLIPPKCAIPRLSVQQRSRCSLDARDFFRYSRWAVVIVIGQFVDEIDDVRVGAILPGALHQFFAGSRVIDAGQRLLHINGTGLAGVTLILRMGGMLRHACPPLIQCECYANGRTPARGSSTAQARCLCVRELREPRLLLHCFVANGSFDPILVLTQREPITNAIEAYQAFDAREPGWIKVKLEP